MTPAKAANRKISARKKRALESGHRQFILDAADAAGLLDGEKRLVSARLSRRLVNTAKRRTGIKSNTDLLLLALASIAIEWQLVGNR